MGSRTIHWPKEADTLITQELAPTSPDIPDGDEFTGYEITMLELNAGEPLILKDDEPTGDHPTESGMYISGVTPTNPGNHPDIQEDVPNDTD